MITLKGTDFHIKPLGKIDNSLFKPELKELTKTVAKLSQTKEWKEFVANGYKKQPSQSEIDSQIGTNREGRSSI